MNSDNFLFNKRTSRIISLFIALVFVILLYGCDTVSIVEDNGITGTQSNVSDNETSSSENTQETADSTTDTTSTTTLKNTEVDEPVTEQTILKGRGKSDAGRSEPQYESITGYVASYKIEE